MIEVRLFASLRKGREKIIYLEPTNFFLAEDVLKYLKIQPEEAAIYLINGRHSKLDSSVKDGDIIAIFPPAGGG